MIVICDASPIIALAAVGRLDLVRELYGEAIIPRAVHEEITLGPGGAELIAGAPWLFMRDARDRSVVGELEGEVDRGEAEAIALAIELAADLIIIDDRRGRIAAARRGIPLTGVVGILLEARTRGLIGPVGPVLDELQTRAGFRLGESVRRQALEAAGEIPPVD